MSDEPTSTSSSTTDDPDHGGAISSIATSSTTTPRYWYERRTLPLWFWLLPLLLVLPVWYGAIGLRHHVEGDIHGRAVAALAALNANGVTAGVDGRDVTLLGTLPAGIDAATVHNAVRDLSGVRHVRDTFDVVSVAAPSTVDASANTAAAESNTASATSLTPGTTAAPVTTTAAPTTTASPATTTQPAPTTQPS